MKKSEIIEKLYQFDLIHKPDYDGGYSLVSEIRSYSLGLNEEERKILKEVLLDFVRNREINMWGVSLEALIQEWGKDVSQELLNLLEENREFDDEWTHHIIFSLLRLGETSAKETYIKYITKHLERNDYTVLPLLAALVRVDSNLSVDIAARFFAQLTEKDFIKGISGYIPAFVHNFIEIDANLLFRLVESTKVISKKSGGLLVKLLIEYLERPYVKKKIGYDEVERLINRLAMI
jgi:hypothetical protein